MFQWAATREGQVSSVSLWKPRPCFGKLNLYHITIDMDMDKYKLFHVVVCLLVSLRPVSCRSYVQELLLSEVKLFVLFTIFQVFNTLVRPRILFLATEISFGLLTDSAIGSNCGLCFTRNFSYNFLTGNLPPGLGQRSLATL
jgi:hypothetical protein